MIEIRQTVNSNLMTFRGSSQEDKPMTCAPGSTFYEWDTCNGYMFTGEEWLQQTSGGGGGGGGSFGTCCGVLVCGLTDNMPDPSKVYAYRFDAGSGNNLIASGNTSNDIPMVSLAAGLDVTLFFNETLASDPDIALYNFDSNGGTITEIPDALDISVAMGYVTEIKFTMPELEDWQNNIALIGIPQSQ